LGCSLSLIASSFLSASELRLRGEISRRLEVFEFLLGGPASFAFRPR
jgi:hypothetical protein